MCRLGTAFWLLIMAIASKCPLQQLALTQNLATQHCMTARFTLVGYSRLMPCVVLLSISTSACLIMTLYVCADVASGRTNGRDGPYPARPDDAPPAEYGGAGKRLLQDLGESLCTLII